MGEGFESRRDALIGVDGRFGFGGNFGERCCAEISCGTLQGMSEALGCGSVIGDERSANVADYGRLGICESVKE